VNKVQRNLDEKLSTIINNAVYVLMRVDRPKLSPEGRENAGEGGRLEILWQALNNEGLATAKSIQTHGNFIDRRTLTSRTG